MIIPLSLSGCLEARLWLSDQSRLPKWVVVPKGKNRNDFSVKMESHSTVTAGKIIFKIYYKDNVSPIQEYEITTTMQSDILPAQLKLPPKGFPQGFPKYIPITVNGITDIVEQRKMEPVFYMTDDPSIWKEFGVENLGK
ncbi:MAG: hypothetical protein V1782_13155 [Pseudomonadota bacterium]